MLNVDIASSFKNISGYRNHFPVLAERAYMLFISRAVTVIGHIHKGHIVRYETDAHVKSE